VNDEPVHPLSRDDFIEWLRREGAGRYHDKHKFHQLMHEGKLNKTNCNNGS